MLERGEAGIQAGQRGRYVQARQLRQLLARCGNTAVVQIEVAGKQFFRLRQVSDIVGLVPVEQGQSRGEQTQFEILPKKEFLLRHQQRRFTLIQSAYLNDAFEFAEQVLAKAMQPVRDGRPGLPDGRLADQRPAIDARHQAIEADGQAGVIDLGDAAQLGQIFGDGGPEAGKLRQVLACQPGIGGFQRQYGGLDVAGQLQLLAGGEQDAFDFRQRPLVAVTGQFLV